MKNGTCYSSGMFFPQHPARAHAFHSIARTEFISTMKKPYNVNSQSPLGEKKHVDLALSYFLNCASVARKEKKVSNNIKLTLDSANPCCQSPSSREVAELSLPKVRFLTGDVNE